MPGPTHTTCVVGLKRKSVFSRIYAYIELNEQAQKKEDLTCDVTKDRIKNLTSRCTTNYLKENLLYKTFYPKKNKKQLVKCLIYFCKHLRVCTQS